VKVFISWSGDTSRQVARILRDWLSDVIQSIEPWMSEVDIEKGTQSMSEIRKELAGTGFGVAVVTKDNQGRPWLNFEAGTLSEAVPTDEKTRPWVVLFDMKNADLLEKRPIGEFQTTLCNEEEFWLLIKSMNGASTPTLPELKLRNAFDKRWPDLAAQLAGVTTRVAPPEDQEATVDTAPVGHSDAAIDEIIGLCPQAGAPTQQPSQRANSHH
jgi:hypothetical protein